MIAATAESVLLSLQIRFFVHDLPMLRGGWGRRGADLLRPSLRARQDRAPTLGCGSAALGNMRASAFSPLDSGQDRDGDAPGGAAQIGERRTVLSYDRERADQRLYKVTGASHPLTPARFADTPFGPDRAKKESCRSLHPFPSYHRLVVGRSSGLPPAFSRRPMRRWPPFMSPMAP